MASSKDGVGRLQKISLQSTSLNDELQDAIQDRIQKKSFEPSKSNPAFRVPVRQETFSFDGIGSFSRHVSFMDIKRQTTENELSITLHANDTIIHRIFPQFSKRMISFYSPKRIAILTVFIGIAIFTSDYTHIWILRISIVVFFLFVVSVALIHSYPVMQYSLLHSFDLRLLLLTQVISIASVWTLKFGNNDTNQFWIDVLFRFSTMNATPIVYTLEGTPHFKQAWKQTFLFIISLFATWRLVAFLYEIGDNSYSQYEDKSIRIPQIDLVFSVKQVILLCAFNGTVFWWKKLVFVVKHPGCIFIAAYPQIVWVYDGVHRHDDTQKNKTSRIGLWAEEGLGPQSRIGMKSSRSDFGMRAKSFSMDIYKQTVRQDATFYLFENKSILHRLFDKETAEELHQIHFSKASSFGIFVTATIAFGANILSVPFISIFSEVCCILILSMGPFTFDMEMMRFYLKSFEFWFKWFNWTLFLFAFTIWNNLESETNGLIWTEFVLRNLMITIIIFYIVCIDAYHVQDRYKKWSLTLLLVLFAYYQSCNLLQIFALKPWKRWDDHDIVIPLLQIQVSLRSMMMSTLSNFILFMGKQLFVMLKHPGAAAFELFPRILWIGEGEDYSNDQEQ